MRFCLELEWNGSLPAQGGVRTIELESPFYHLHMLCDDLEVAGMWMVLVDGDHSHIVVAKGFGTSSFRGSPMLKNSGCIPARPKCCRLFARLRRLPRVFFSFSRGWILLKGGSLGRSWPNSAILLSRSWAVHLLLTWNGTYRLGRQKVA